MPEGRKADRKTKTEAATADDEKMVSTKTNPSANLALDV